MEILSWLLKVLTLLTRVKSVNVTGLRCPMDPTVKRSVAMLMVLLITMEVVTISAAASPAPSPARDQP